jgi:hypothetical protein
MGCTEGLTLKVYQPEIYQRVTRGLLWLHARIWTN